MKRLASLLLFAVIAVLFIPAGCREPGCTAHDDCETGEVCLFGSGVCAPGCDPMEAAPCNGSAKCSMCATSSCPGCRDCVAACVSAGGKGGPAGGW